MYMDFLIPANCLLSFLLLVCLNPFQLLQQLYNMADAWVVGNFASNDAFAAVSLSSNVNMSVITFFAGIAVGGGVDDRLGAGVGGLVCGVDAQCLAAGVADALSPAPGPGTGRSGPAGQPDCHVRAVVN